MYIGLWPGEAKQGARRATAHAPPIMFLEGNCPPKIPSCDVVFVIIIKSCSLKWRNN